MSEAKVVRATGRCMCGAIRYTVRGPLRAGTVCHCDECRRQTGSFWHATAAYEDTVEIDDAENQLAWYRSSDHARRGFCKRCGSSLFFDPDGAERLAISMGSLDKPTGVELARHIFIEEKGDYYEIPDDIPSCEGYAIAVEMPRE